MTMPPPRPAPPRAAAFSLYRKQSATFRRRRPSRPLLGLPVAVAPLKIGLNPLLPRHVAGYLRRGEPSLPHRVATTSPTNRGQYLNGSRSRPAAGSAVTRVTRSSSTKAALQRRLVYGGYGGAEETTRPVLDRHHSWRPT